MAIDHIKFRFNALKWAVLLAAIAAPVITYFVTRDMLGLKTTNVWLWVIGAVYVSAFILYKFNRYIEDGFGRYYASGGNWDYLASRFFVDRKPVDVVIEWNGVGRLERTDVMFNVDAGASDNGLYVNVNALGRILIPWIAIRSLKRERLPTEKGWQELVAVEIEGADIDFTIPWSREVDEVVPQGIGIT